MALSPLGAPLYSGSVKQSTYPGSNADGLDALLQGLALAPPPPVPVTEAPHDPGHVDRSFPGTDEPFQATEALTQELTTVAMSILKSPVVSHVYKQLPVSTRTLYDPQIVTPQNILDRLKFDLKVPFGHIASLNPSGIRDALSLELTTIDDAQTDTLNRFLQQAVLSGFVEDNADTYRKSIIAIARNAANVTPPLIQLNTLLTSLSRPGEHALRNLIVQNGGKFDASVLDEFIQHSSSRKDVRMLLGACMKLVSPKQLAGNPAALLCVADALVVGVNSRIRQEHYLTKAVQNGDFGAISQPDKNLGLRQEMNTLGTKLNNLVEGLTRQVLDGLNACHDDGSVWGLTLDDLLSDKLDVGTLDAVIEMAYKNSVHLNPMDAPPFVPLNKWLIQGKALTEMLGQDIIDLVKKHPQKGDKSLVENHVLFRQKLFEKFCKSPPEKYPYAMLDALCKHLKSVDLSRKNQTGLAIAVFINTRHQDFMPDISFKFYRFATSQHSLDQLGVKVNKTKQLDVMLKAMQSRFMGHFKRAYEDFSPQYELTDFGPLPVRSKLDILANIRSMNRHVVHYVKSHREAGRLFPLSRHNRSVLSGDPLPEVEERSFSISFSHQSPTVGILEMSNNVQVTRKGNMMEKVSAGNSRSSPTYTNAANDLAKLMDTYNLTDADIAKFMRSILNGGTDAILTDPRFQSSNGRERKSVLETLFLNTVLMFGIEPTRNPSALVHHVMILDLIEHGQMSWKEAWDSIDQGAYLRGAMPMSMKEAVKASRRQLDAYNQLGPAIFYDYPGEVEMDKSANSATAELTRRQNALVERWAHFRHGAIPISDSQFVADVRARVTQFWLG